MDDFNVEAGPDVVTPDPSLEEHDSNVIEADTGDILASMAMDEELWAGGPTRATVEEFKKKYPTSDIRASLLANETGIIWRTLNRSEWRELNNLSRNVQDEEKREEILFQKIVLFPDCSDIASLDKLPAGVLPVVLKEFYLYAGFQPVADSLKLQPMDTSTLTEWRQISQKTWDICDTFAKAIDDDKRHLGDSTYWNKNAHFVGLIGEALVANVLKLPINLELIRGGDGKLDFQPPGDLLPIDVKTSTFLRDPHLKAHPNELKRDKLFVLVVVDLKQRKARICGSATSQELLKAQRVNYGYGLMCSLPEDMLTPGIPSVYIHNN